MACSPSPVASKAWHDISARYGSRVGYLGIVGDQAHQTRISSHNCWSMQESSLVDPRTGLLVPYPDEYAHALDVDVFGDHDLAAEIIRFMLADPWYRLRYCLHNGKGYQPQFRGGAVFGSSDHERHVHMSFTPWSTFDVRPFLLGQPLVLTPEKRAEIAAQANAAAAHRPFLHLGSSGSAVERWQQVLDLQNRDGEFGPGTQRATQALQRRFGLRQQGDDNYGSVDRRTWSLGLFFGLLRYYGYASR